jgi:hypothetical protein
MEPHVPPCILSAEDVMVTFNEVRNYRAVQFPNWQKRGKKSRKRNNRSDHESDEESAEEKHSAAENTKPNRSSPKRLQKKGDGNQKGVLRTNNPEPPSPISHRGKITSFFLSSPSS